MDRISELLYKQFNGTITEKERHELQAWRDICPENEELASRICDNRWLTGEFRMRSLIDTGRPCGEMERRIRNIRSSINSHYGMCGTVPAHTARTSCVPVI